MNHSQRPGWLSGLVLAVIGAGCHALQVSGAPADRHDGAAGAAGGNGTASGGGFALPDGGAPPPPGAAANPGQQCAEQAYRAERVPLDLMILMDASGSMLSMAGATTKWEQAQAAITAFVRDPRSAGMGVGLHFFPSGHDTPCETDVDCGGSSTSPLGFLCQALNLCAGPNGPGPAVDLEECRSDGGPSFPPLPPGAQPGCPRGTMCLPAGRCTGNRTIFCTNVGEACPMGRGMCVGAPKTCRIMIPRPAQCETATYQKPAVPIGDLPMSERAFIGGLESKDPGGGTPMGPAVRGVLAHLRAHLAANPGRKVALVVTGDGVPGGCAANDIPSIAANLGEAFTGTPSIPTYAIGVFHPNEMATGQSLMDQLAIAGGTDRAFVVSATAELNQRLQETLGQIRGAATLGCEFNIPPPSTTMGAIDFNRVNVRYTGPAGPEDIVYVERGDRCDPGRGGWYYDVELSRGIPRRILMCAATCRRFETEQNAKVDLLFGCATRVIL